jgi:hypothetical protein
MMAEGGELSDWNIASTFNPDAKAKKGGKLPRFAMVSG